MFGNINTFLFLALQFYSYFWISNQLSEDTISFSDVIVATKNK